MRKSYLYPLLILLGLFLFACDKDDRLLDFALSRAGQNRAELEHVLAHYKNEPEKLEAARFLIRNMIGKQVLDSNSVRNLQIKELYINKVSGEKSAPHVLTTARIETSSIALGDIPLGESAEATFTLTNTGKRPLVIMDVATTCGCAEPSFDKHPVQPSDSLHVKVRMTPKDKGFFNEVITVKCNTCQMIRFSIRGNAI